LILFFFFFVFIAIRTAGREKNTSREGKWLINE